MQMFPVKRLSVVDSDMAVKPVCFFSHFPLDFGL